MMMGVKQLYGATCIGGVFFLLLLMLYDVQPIRSSLKHVPVWNKVGKAMKEEMRRPKDHNPL
jgi:DHA2 family multidrug resistance protein